MFDNKVIPVFFSCDDNYLPFLSVAISSLSAHAKSDCIYRIYVLNDGMNEQGAEKIKTLETEKIKIDFVNVSDRIAPYIKKLPLRDYYTISIYFRIFIPVMFPEYDRAVYLDADTVILSDIAELYNTDLGGNLLGAVPDAIIAGYPEYLYYAERAVGVPYRRYFNSGVLLMNLVGLRGIKVEEKFLYLLCKYHFNTICPDQDYLNAICRGRVKYLDSGWNKMSIDENYPGTPMLVHYNMYWKPWLYKNISYEKYFWQYAEKSNYYSDILKAKKEFGFKGKLKNAIAAHRLKNTACSIAERDDNFRCVLFAGELEEEYFGEEANKAVAGQA